MVRKLFDSLKREKFETVYATILYNGTRCTTGSLMLNWLIKVRSPVTLLNYALLNAIKQRGTNSRLLLPNALKKIITSSTYWPGSEELLGDSNPVSSCLGSSESDF